MTNEIQEQAEITEQEPLTFLQRFSILQMELKIDKSETATAGKARYNFYNLSQLISAAKSIIEINNLELLLHFDDKESPLNPDNLISTATIKDVLDGNNEISSSSVTRFDGKAFMGASQQMGAMSSYGRKYALAGLLAVNESKDFDELQDDFYDYKNAEEGGKQYINNYLDYLCANQKQSIFAIFKQSNKDRIIKMFSENMVANNQMDSFRALCSINIDEVKKHIEASANSNKEGE